LTDVAAVRAVGLVKRFGAAVAVDHVDLRVEAGSVHGLLGPNGAGKTTVLRMLFGLIRPDAGTLHVPDRPAGFVESPRFYPYLSGRRNLELLSALDGGAAPGRVDEVLDAVELGERRDHKVGRYSLGMRQRLGVAAALLPAPRLLVLDEPANGLDPAAVRDLHTLIRGLAGQGAAVLMSSHHMGEVEALCDQLTIMRSGSVVYAGSIEQLRAQAPAPAYRLETSDDVQASTLAQSQPALRVAARAGGGLTVHAERADLDAYIIGLGRAGVAVRALAAQETPLEALFLSLTGATR
jgi:ABC-2 type transport system ATP-binding protein